MTSKRSVILDTAKKLISGNRQQTYGDAKDDFSRTGQLWAVVLGTPAIPAWKVAICLAMVKVSRLVATSGAHEDSWVDGCGYLALGGEIGIPTGPLGASIAGSKLSEVNTPQGTHCMSCGAVSGLSHSPSCPSQGLPQGQGPRG